MSLHKINKTYRFILEIKKTSNKIVNALIKYIKYFQSSRFHLQFSRLRVNELKKNNNK